MKSVKLLLMIFLSIIFIAQICGQGRCADTQDTPAGTYDVKVTELFTIAGHDNEATSVGFSPDGKLLASGDTKGMLKLWSVETGEEVKSIQAHSDRITGLDFSPDGDLIATSSQDDTVKLWSVATGESFFTYNGHSNNVECVAFHPSGEYVLSGGWDTTAQLWSIRDGTVKLRVKVKHPVPGCNWIRSCAVSPDGKYVSVGSAYIDVFEIESGKSVFRVERKLVQGTAFDRNSNIVASCGKDKRVSLYFVCNGISPKYKDNPHKGNLTHVCFSPTDDCFVSCGDDKQIVIWRIPELFLGLVGTDKPIDKKSFDADQPLQYFVLPEQSDEVKCVDFNNDSTKLASACKDGSIKIWSVELP